MFYCWISSLVESVIYLFDAIFFVSTFQNFTQQSKFTYGLVMEEITTRDETSTVCTHGVRALPVGGLSIDGPPTTLSGTGTDRMAFAQANITRDNTRFLNGAIVGERDVFQVHIAFFRLALSAIVVLVLVSNFLIFAFISKQTWTCLHIYIIPWFISQQNFE